MDIKLLLKKRNFKNSFNKAVKFANNGDYNAAAYEFEKAIAVYKGYFEYYDAYWGLGKAYREIGEMNKAEEMLTKAIEIDPQRKEAHLHLGIVYHDLEMYKMAKEEYEKALEIDPSDKNHYLHLGMVLGELGEYDKAYEVLKQAVKLDKNFIRAYFSLGVLFEVQSSFDEALSWFQKALDIGSEYQDEYLEDSDIKKHIDICVNKKNN
ncbi:MAG: tetratricopeptide repeat protein [Candidatus Omnitrophota bacterium]